MSGAGGGLLGWGGSGGFLWRHFDLILYCEEVESIELLFPKKP